MPMIYIPSVLRRFSEHKAQVQLPLEQGTFTQLLARLDDSYPGIKAQICEDSGVIKAYVNVFVNGHEIRCLDGLETVVRGEDEVFIVPAMAGG